MEEGAGDAKVDLKPEEDAAKAAGAEPMEASTNGTNGAGVWASDARFKQLVEKGLEESVAAGLLDAMEAGRIAMTDVDERVVEMMKGMKADQANYVTGQLRQSSMVGVQNKASFLMALMKNFKDRVRTQGLEAAMSQPLIAGPSGDSLQGLLERTGYSLEVTLGQRKYGGPPPQGPATLPSGPGHECYVGHVPKELFEDALIPLFEDCGTIWDLRLMMDPVTGANRGYAFVTFVEPGAAKKCAQKYTGYEIRPGRKLKVNVSVANTRLFLGNIPKSKSKEEILEELKNHTEGVRDVIVYTNPDAGEGRKNRGFCFADFEDHKSASDARRRLAAGKSRPFNCDLVVDWAEAQEEPDDDIMDRVKVLYVRNLREAVTEDELREIFAPFGQLERVKKLRDYAFVHFAERPEALAAMEAKQGHMMAGLPIEITLAKPQMDKAKRERMKAERDRRQMFQFQRGGGRGRGRGGPMGYGGYDDGYGGYGGYGGGWGGGYGGGGWGGPGYGPPRGRGRGGRGGPFVGSLGSMARQMTGGGGGWGGGYGGDDWGYGAGGEWGGGGYDEYGGGDGWAGGDWTGISGGPEWGGYDDYGKPPGRGFGRFATSFRGGRGGGGFKRKNEEMGEGGFPKRPAPDAYGGGGGSGGGGGYAGGTQPDWSADVDTGF